MHRLLFLIPAKSYRATLMMDAIAKLQSQFNFEVVIGSEARQAMSSLFPDKFLLLDFNNISLSVEIILKYNSIHAIEQVIAFDEEALLLANLVNDKLSKVANSPSAVTLTKNKALMRIALSKSDVSQPKYCYLHFDSDGNEILITALYHDQDIDLQDITDKIKNPGLFSNYEKSFVTRTLEKFLDKAENAALKICFPVVVKAVGLSGSRGIIRANNVSELRIAVLKAVAIATVQSGQIDLRLLIEEYIPGAEVAVDAFMQEDEIIPLAIFDKPDPLEGPYFEETIYITPSRYDPKTQSEIIEAIQKTCRHLGIKKGPIHAELRLAHHQDSQREQNTFSDNKAMQPSFRPTLLEIASRPIGGHCGDILNFLDGMSLYEVLISLYINQDLKPNLDQGGFGAMMLPIVKTGILKEVIGTENARDTEGVCEIAISIPKGNEVIEIPEGDRYLGFILSRGNSPEEAEKALRSAYGKLRIAIEETALSASIISVLESNGGLEDIFIYTDTLLTRIKADQCAS